MGMLVLEIGSQLKKMEGGGEGPQIPHYFLLCIIFLIFIVW